MFEIFLILLIILLVVFAFYALWKPPKKHKNFSLSDQNKATIRAMGGGSGPPDESDYIPPELKQEGKH